MPSSDSPIGERMARVEEQLRGLADDIQGVKNMLTAQNVARVESRRAVRTWVVALVAVFLAIPASVTASINVYHLIKPSHTIVQNLPIPKDQNVR